MNVLLPNIPIESLTTKQLVRLLASETGSCPRHSIETNKWQEEKHSLPSATTSQLIRLSYLQLCCCTMSSHGAVTGTYIARLPAIGCSSFLPRRGIPIEYDYPKKSRMGSDAACDRHSPSTKLIYVSAVTRRPNKFLIQYVFPNNTHLESLTVAAPSASCFGEHCSDFCMGSTSI